MKFPDSEPVLVVVNNNYERRYYFSARAATRGLGWLNWPEPNQSSAGKVEVYRLDEEATDALNQALLQDPREYVPHTGSWTKATADRLSRIIQNCTGIKGK